MSSAENHDVGRRTGVVGFFTLISRVFGLARDIILAKALGASATADAFYVAFRIPNLLRRLLAEGSMTISFVPVFSEYLRKSKEEGKAVADIIFTYLTIILVIVVVLGMVLAPFVVKLIAFGFDGSSEKYRLTVYLTRLMFPYIFLVSLAALAMGILNTRKHFASPAASPILLNIAIIIAAAFVAPQFSEPTVAVALGVLVGGCAQLALQIPFLKREGFLPRFRFHHSHPALKKLGSLYIPSIFGSAVYQLNVLVITLLASFLPSGSITYLWYADRMTEFPLGVFSIAIATATLPTLSEHAAENNRASFNEALLYSLRVAFLGIIPAAVGLFALAGAVISLLFQRGEFSAEASHATAQALQCFVIGMPFISGVRNFVPAFYAKGDSKTPVKASAVALAINFILALSLMQFFQHLGLAISIALSSMCNFFILAWYFRRHYGMFGGMTLYQSILKSLAASLVMFGVMELGLRYGKLQLMDNHYILGLYLLLFIIMGLSAYLVALRLISRRDFNDLLAIVRRRLKN